MNSITLTTHTMPESNFEDFQEQVQCMQDMSVAAMQSEKDLFSMLKAKQSTLAKIDWSKWAQLGIALVEAIKVFTKYAFKNGEWRKPGWLAWGFVAAIFKALMVIIRITGKPKD